MPDEASGGSVKVRLDGSHLRVDARPARLVSLLKTGDGPAVLTAQPLDGPTHSEALPNRARQATFQVRDDVTVEATSNASFVAVAEDAGGCIVLALDGEVTVVPRGDDRFALAPQEALVLPVGDGAPSVVPAAELTAANHPDLAALLDAAADAVLAPPAPAAVVEDEGVVEVEEAEATEATEEMPVVAVPAGGATKAATAGKKAATPAKAASKSQGGGNRRKKGKKGRPQPSKQAGKKAAGVAGAAAGAAGATGATSPAKAAGATKASTGRTPPPPKQPPKGGGGGGGGDDDDSYEDSPRDKRFIVGAVLVALLLAVGVVWFLTAEGDDGQVAVGTDTTTTSAAAETTTTAEAPATTTTAAPASTTTARAATNTTARAATTTAKPAATTTPPPAPKYSIQPKSCVQNGNSITYTASVKNEASVAYDFTVDVSFKGSDGSEVAKATATVTRLGAGRTADFSATGTSSRNLTGVGSCDVTRVDAQPSGS